MYFFQCIHPSSHPFIFLQNRGDQTGFYLLLLFSKENFIFKKLFFCELSPPTPLFRLCPLFQSCPYSSNYFCSLTQLLLPNYCFYLTQLLLPNYCFYLTQLLLPNYCFYLTQLLLHYYCFYLTQLLLPNYCFFPTKLLPNFPTIVSVLPSYFHSFQLLFFFLVSYLHSSQLLFLSYSVTYIIPNYFCYLTQLLLPNYCFYLTQLLAFFPTIVSIYILLRSYSENRSKKFQIQGGYAPP